MAGVSLRLATLADATPLRRLIGVSVRTLARGDYSDVQIKAALRSAWAVDTQLIEDGTYFVGEAAGAIIACGGWSWRRTLFGGDDHLGRQPDVLDPAHDAARIPAFFINPQWARKGIGSRILLRCEREARAFGFRSLELVATLPGERFYRAHGYSGAERREYALAGGLSIAFVSMRKDLS
ncbi:MAG: GNAT family N-acetyltransferase [Deltaproteobacteria bacterium]|nr:GNAT family N-acetyltransferase [Deltaproteobacteria bacterium]